MLNLIIFDIYIYIYIYDIYIYIYDIYDIYSIPYFIKDKNGDIVNIKTRTPKGAEVLGKATKALFEKLPKFIPGKHEGKVANVKHVFPIDFKLD